MRRPDGIKKRPAPEAAEPKKSAGVEPTSSREPKLGVARTKKAPAP